MSEPRPAPEPRVNQPDDTITLFCSVGPGEYLLIEKSGFRAFPPRTGQPMFYPVLTEAFALKIAHEWIVPDLKVAYVTRFKVRRAYLSRYPVDNAGGKDLDEYWIPAADLPEFNQNIVGPIEIIRQFHAAG
ncbi:ADP-ribosylation/crystallin J1 [Rhodoplanes sp. Z2-YC6860]|nr:ADP-ribosylation/crystallin J1 [Rhodoplanes sp. Z2-YC6860]